MASLVPTCPSCGSIDMVIERRALLYDQNTGNAGAARCPNCEWSGETKETIAAFFKDKEVVWDIERIGSVLLGVVTEYAAGPMVQVFEFAGMVGPDDFEAKGSIMRACVEAVTTAGFLAAHEAHVAKLRQRLQEDGVPEDEMMLIRKVVKQLDQQATPGETAFAAYDKSRGGVNHRGEPTPPWAELPCGIQEAWEAAASAVAR